MEKKTTNTNRKKRRKKRNTKKFSFVQLLINLGIGLLSTILILVIFIYLVIFVVIKGPSPNAKNLMVFSLNETSALKWIPHLYLSKDQINEILNPAPEENEYVEFAMAPNSMYQTSSNEGDEEFADTYTEPIEIIDLKSSTYKGKIMLVHDPSRIIVGTIDHFGGAGMVVQSIIDKYNGVAGTNAGGFEDEGGHGAGGTPDGLVIRDGKLAYGSPNLQYIDVIGFDENHQLHVGNMTGQQALDVGIVNGTSFHMGPVLIKDGQRQPNLAGGINPRTAIGQMADGTVILIAIEGRLPDSLGATYADLADVMEEYGAVNAANLDGGSSSGLFVGGERLTRSSSVIGDRPVPTAIVVLPEGAK